jgi:hypothetical protein
MPILEFLSVRSEPFAVEDDQGMGVRPGGDHVVTRLLIERSAIVSLIEHSHMRLTEGRGGESQRERGTDKVERDLRSNWVGNYSLQLGVPQVAYLASR